MTTKAYTDMQMKYIQQTYGVLAKIGGIVKYRSKQGKIIGAKNGYLQIRLDGETEIRSYHPTWEMEYCDDNGDE